MVGARPRQPETIRPILVAVAVAATCCELANRGKDSIRNFESVFTATLNREITPTPIFWSKLAY